MRAIGKHEKAALACVARAVARADPARADACTAKADARLAVAFAGVSGCDGTASECEPLADDCRGAVTRKLPDLGPSACEATRIKAAGRTAARRLACYAKAAARQVAVDGACLERASARFDATFARTTGCSGERAAVEDAVDAACVARLVSAPAGAVTRVCPDPVAGRAYRFVVPSGYEPAIAMPLVVMLHGYGASASFHETYLKLAPAAEAKGFLYAYPDGTVDADGKRFWNATDACCDFYGSSVDDVGYLGAVIDDMKSKYNVDAARVFVVGHSNGAFMAHRLACDLSSKLTGIVSLEGATWNDPDRCRPALPVTVLHVHGTADNAVAYTGGTLGGIAYPSAPVSASTWADHDGCAPTPDGSAPPLDLDVSLPGAETTVAAYPGCVSGSAVQLWTIQGGDHAPALSATWFDPVYGFLVDHPRP
ncbi:MAG TPA: PHB depolymerase family esterase [Candidatus Binatia bacterium]|nr:PHB depolymerase family esterase [Candidatus Binatia bacterium]